MQVIRSLPSLWQRKKADHAEAEKSSASLNASQPASKSTCGQVASDHETSVKAFAEGLKVLARSNAGVPR